MLVRSPMTAKPNSGVIFSGSSPESSKAFELRSPTAERSGVEGFPEVTLTFSTGLKAWPRRLRRLRCGLDFARNDGCKAGRNIAYRICNFANVFRGRAAAAAYQIQP